MKHVIKQFTFCVSLLAVFSCQKAKMAITKNTGGARDKTVAVAAPSESPTGDLGLVPQLSWVGGNSLTDSQVTLQIDFGKKVTFSNRPETLLKWSGTANATLRSIQPTSTTQAFVTFIAANPGTLTVSLADGFASDNASQVSPASTSIRLNIKNYFATIATGHRHSCGLTFSKDVYCWGCSLTSFSAADICNASQKLTKMSFPGLASDDSVTTVASGAYFSCVLTAKKHMYCWGENIYETVPDGVAISSPQASTPWTAARIQPSPILVDSYLGLGAGETPEKLALGHQHGCLISSANKVYCWGRWAYGQLGIGSTCPTGCVGIDANVSTPTAIDTTNLNFGEYFVSLHAGYFGSCGITNQNRPFCWGSNNFGDAGVSSGSNYVYIPTLVDTANLNAGERFTILQKGSYNGCGITNQHNLYCWGNAANGVLGNPAYSTNQSKPVPVTLSALSPGEYPVGLSASFDWISIITNLGKAYSWGSNRLLSGTTSLSNLGLNRFDVYVQTIPTEVSRANFGSAQPTFSTIVLNTSGSQCVMTPDHRIYTWGRNDFQQFDSSGATIGAPKFFDDSALND